MDVKNKLSKRNPYHLSKHRYLELKHWCLQYQEWQDEILALSGVMSRKNSEIKSNDISNPTENSAIRIEKLSRRVDLVKHCCMIADEELATYIFKAVTQDYSYDYLQTIMDIPCCRDTYYDRYRKFFYILDKKKD